MSDATVIHRTESLDAMLRLYFSHNPTFMMAGERDLFRKLFRRIPK